VVVVWGDFNVAVRNSFQAGGGDQVRFRKNAAPNAIMISDRNW
jgi:hypothetical protein